MPVPLIKYYIMLTKRDKKIISLISRDVPLVNEPFRELARQLKVKENEIINRIKIYKRTGFMRKFAAVVNHRKVGFKYNAMAVWNVPSKFVEKYGKIMTLFNEVSHCYQRKKSHDWNYNLYCMIHGKTKKECLSTVKEISKKISSKNYKVLFSSMEYKKTGVKY